MDYDDFTARALPAGVMRQVFAANDELECNDRDDAAPCPGYHRLSAEANERGLGFRRHLAEAIYLLGSPSLRSSRAFDNCFENGDGAQVVAHLVERARSNPSLWNAIARDFGGTFPAQWLDTADKAQPQGQLAFA